MHQLDNVTLLGIQPSESRWSSRTRRERRSMRLLLSLSWQSAKRDRRERGRRPHSRSPQRRCRPRSSPLFFRTRLSHPAVPEVTILTCRTKLLAFYAGVPAPPTRAAGGPRSLGLAAQAAARSKRGRSGAEGGISFCLCSVTWFSVVLYGISNDLLF